MTRRGGAVLQADTEDRENTANGTGPFVLEDGGWNVGASITLTRNDEYWGDLPAISEVTFQYFTDQNAMVNAFTTGDVDIVTGIQSDLVEPLRDNPDYVVNEGTTNGEFTLGFNNEREPFTDPAVRKAIRQAIDKDAYKELNNGFGTIIGGPVPPSDPWYEDLTDVAPYDPEAAQAALDAAGYGDGLELTLTWPNLYSTTNADFVASQLAEVGITVDRRDDRLLGLARAGLRQPRLRHDGRAPRRAPRHRQLRRPRLLLAVRQPGGPGARRRGEGQPGPGGGRRAAQGGRSADLRGLARRLVDPRGRPHRVDADVTGYPTNDTGSRFDASGITVTS